jgi:golgi-specific brefeldin A-resistance guanine nucleotide exchange factor 1
MQASGALLPPREPDDRSQDLQQRWKSTQERLDQFLPGFLQEIIPSESVQSQPIAEKAPAAPAT